MRPRILFAPAVAVALAVNVPVAQAALVRSGCGMVAVSGPDSQDLFTGVAYAYAVFDDNGPHRLQCYITVDGAPQASTPVGMTNVYVAATAGLITYDAPDGATVDVCTEINGVTVSCGPASELDVPPPVVRDSVDTVIRDVILPILVPPARTLCPLLGSLAPGVPGVVDIDRTGDTRVLGRYLVDCPPSGAGPTLLPPLPGTLYRVQSFIGVSI